MNDTQKFINLYLSLKQPEQGKLKIYIENQNFSIQKNNNVRNKMSIYFLSILSNYDNLYS
jgi:hypothetical protein